MGNQDKKQYDVIIVGASFAGLAAASQIKTGRTLLIDVKPIGTGIKSACATALDTVSKFGLDECILQVHKKMIFHTAFSSFTCHLKSPFCIITGKKFCRTLFEKGRAEFVQAAVLDFDGEILRTNKGNFRADIFIDASGPNSILTKNKSRYLSFGIETIVDYKEKGLHFWYEPKVFPKGVFWLFPQGKTSRIGIGSYTGETNLISYLDEFLKRFGLKKTDDIHGGYFSHRIKDPVFGKIFLAGDSAGQCFPITGEGIRPAIFFGQKLGEIINHILQEKITHYKGLELYRDFVLHERKFKYELMYYGQKSLPIIPQSLVSFFTWLTSKRLITNFVLDKYLNILK